MRYTTIYIISKFHDYYDSVLAQGIDKTLVYKRETQEFTININPYRTWEQVGAPHLLEFGEELRANIPRIQNRDWVCMDEEFYATPVVVGFCGKMHLGYRLETSVWQYMGSKKIVQFAWSTNDIICFLKENKMEKSLEKFTGENEKLSKTYRRWGHGKNDKFKKFRKEVMDEVFPMYQNDTRFTNMFIQYNTPVFSWEFKQYSYDVVLKVNPVLTDYEFIKHVDPYTAFQEISMFLGGVLGVGTPEIVTISDKEKAVKHGMDKTSFRNPSPGKKFNRRNK